MCQTISAKEAIAMDIAPNFTLNPINADMPVYLNQAVVIEPLFFRWSVWPHLLSPVQAALNIAFRYLPLLKSFVSNPRVHISATRDRRLFGGPFVHLSRQDVPTVTDLISATERHCDRLLGLADDLRRFDLALQEGSRGYSLNADYDSLPRTLTGLVELMYDVHDHPKIHLLEELLYSEYGQALRKNAQEISLSTTKDSERGFFMSTPRLESAETLTIPIEYSSPTIDVLASLRYEPLSLRELQQRVPGVDFVDRCPGFLTTEPPERNAID